MYETEVLGKKIVVYPEVMSPKYDHSSEFIIKNLSINEGDVVLEVGSGTGVITLFTLFEGAKKVVATDINPSAVKNTKTNFEKYGFSRNTKVIQGNLFQGLPKRRLFDKIIFNAPFHGAVPKDRGRLWLSVTDPNYRSLKGFMAEVKHYLKQDGVIYLGFSTTGDTELLTQLIHENGYAVAEKISKSRGSYDLLLFKLLPNLGIQPRNAAERYILSDDLRLFQSYRKYMSPSDKTLKIGCGVGFTSKLIEDYLGIVPTILEVKDVRHPQISTQLTLYDGMRIPHQNDRFDTTLAFYMLHHSKSPSGLLKEIYRVSRNVIVIEETPQNFIQQFFLYLNYLLKNLLAGQFDWRIPTFHSKKKWEKIFADAGFYIQTVERLKVKMWYKPYSKHLFVLKKI